MGQLRTTDPIEKATRTIREWLERIGVNGFDLDTKWDARSNVALVRFRYGTQWYEFKSTKQNNCRLNMHGIARVIEYKVRAHLMRIEEFGNSMKAYLALENQSNYQPNTNQSQFSSSPTDEKSYAVLGLSSLASNQELEQAHKKMAKTWHPDNALSQEAKKEFEKRMSEINSVWEQIKKERGI